MLAYMSLYYTKPRRTAGDGIGIIPTAVVYNIKNLVRLVDNSGLWVLDGNRPGGG